MLIKYLKIQETFLGQKNIERQETYETSRLEKQKDINDKVLGDIKNLFRLEKKKNINDKLLRDI